MLDTRSGIVPFTATASRDFIAEKSDTDLNLIETMRRVELNALREALGEIGDKVVDFLESFLDAYGYDTHIKQVAHFSAESASSFQKTWRRLERRSKFNSISDRKDTP